MAGRTLTKTVIFAQDPAYASRAVSGYVTQQRKAAGETVTINNRSGGHGLEVVGVWTDELAAELTRLNKLHMGPVHEMAAKHRADDSRPFYVEYSELMRAQYQASLEIEAGAVEFIRSRSSVNQEMPIFQAAYAVAYRVGRENPSVVIEAEIKKLLTGQPSRAVALPDNLWDNHRWNGRVG